MNSSRLEIIRKIVLGNLYEKCQESEEVSRSDLSKRLKELRKSDCVEGCTVDELANICFLKTYEPSWIKGKEKCIQKYNTENSKSISINTPLSKKSLNTLKKYRKEEYMLGKNILVRVLNGSEVDSSLIKERVHLYNLVHEEIIKEEDLNNIIKRIKKPVDFEEPSRFRLYALDIFGIHMICMKRQLKALQMEVEFYNEAKNLLKVHKEISNILLDSYTPADYVKVEELFKTFYNKVQKLLKKEGDKHIVFEKAPKILKKYKKILEDLKKRYPNEDHEALKLKAINKTFKLIYDYVISWQDLIDTGISFLNGVLPGYFGYLDFFGGGSGDSHTVTAPNLVRLHKEFQVFTVDGQTNACDKSYQQRSYLVGFIDSARMQKLLPLLLNDNRIYVKVVYPDLIRYYDNFSDTSNILNNTRELVDNKIVDFFTNSFRDVQSSYYQVFPYDILYAKQLFIDKVSFDIIVKEYCGTITAEEILLKHLSNL